MKYFILLIILGLVFSSGFCQTFEIPLWPDEVPNSRKTDEKEIHDHSTLEPADEIDIISARPDFMILVYPVISFRESFSHQGSKNALLGENPSDELVDFFSNEMHVTSATPPAFIVHSGDDKSVPVENSLFFYQAMVRQGVMAEMHIYPDGGHGYSLAVGKGYLQTWTDRLYDWLSFLHREQ